MQNMPLHRLMHIQHIFCIFFAYSSEFLHILCMYSAYFASLILSNVKSLHVCCISLSLNQLTFLVANLKLSLWTYNRLISIHVFGINTSCCLSYHICDHFWFPQGQHKQYFLFFFLQLTPQDCLWPLSGRFFFQQTVVLSGQFFDEQPSANSVTTHIILVDTELTLSCFVLVPSTWWALTHCVNLMGLFRTPICNLQLTSLGLWKSTTALYQITTER